MCYNHWWHRLLWRENVTTSHVSGVLTVDVHSHTHLMLLLMESSTARSTSPSSSWRREPTAMSLHQLHTGDQIPRRLLNWPSQTRRKEPPGRRESQQSDLEHSTPCFLALPSFRVARTALSFHVVEYYCRNVFKVCFWIWLSVLPMPFYKILNCTSIYNVLLLQFNAPGNRIQVKNSSSQLPLKCGSKNRIMLDFNY